MEEKRLNLHYSFKVPLLNMTKDSLTKIPLRERSGSIASSRFDYQKDWGICQLLDQYNSDNDFVFFFDWHEDIVIMYSEADPKKISFYQVKGKQNGTWKFSDLLRRSKGKD